MDMRPGVRYWLPAAAMDEEDLREEIRQLAARGFGRIEAVVLGFMLPSIGEDEEWGTEKWNRMTEILADEVQKQGMYLDLTNGPEWPISSPVIQTADEPAALYELTYGELEVSGGVYRGPLPERRKKHGEGKALLLAVMAYEKGIKEKVLIQESYLDLMPYLEQDGTLSCTLPQSDHGWKIFAFYEQPAVQKIKRGGTYVIDHLSKAGIAACEKYWDNVIPNLSLDSMESFFCDSLEYDVTMEWTRGFAEEFESKRGYSVLPYLPVIGLANTYPLTDIPGYCFDKKEISDMINHDYLELITQCYCEKHLVPLQRMAEKYGKSVRYQVAYNRPYEVDRCGLYVAIPENEALGRAAMDLQKNMAAAAHLGRKERYSFECAAEFGHSYGQDYENLFWWVKRSLMSGMNAQVLHGASYSGRYTGETSVNEQLPGVSWPGYEAFGKLVSNYWNRTPSVAHARGCLDAITRMNYVFRQKAKVDCAVMSGRYGSDGLGSEFCLYDDDGILCNYGYSYDFVSEALLELPVCMIKDGELDPDGAAYRCLIIDTQHPLSMAGLRRIRWFAERGLKIVWVGEKPNYGKFFSDWDTEEKQMAWKQALDDAWTCENTVWVSEKKEVPEILQMLGIFPRIEMGEGKTREDVMTAVRTDEKTGITYYILYRYNRVICTPEDPNPDAISVSAIYRKGTLKGSYERPGASSRREMKVRIADCGRVVSCDPWNGMEQKITSVWENGKLSVQVSMEEDEMMILAVYPCEKNEKPYMEAQMESYVGTHMASHMKSAEKEVKIHTVKLYPFTPASEQETSFLRSGFSEEGVQYNLAELKPWRLLDPALEHFSGKGLYEGTIEIDQLPNEEVRCILQLGNVGDTFTVSVNGMMADFPDQVMKRTDITELLREGTNQLQIEVVSNLYNRLFDENTSVGDSKMPYLPRNYGIWEGEEKKIQLIYVNK